MSNASLVPTLASARAALAESRASAETRTERYIASVRQSLAAEGYAVSSDDVRRAILART
jgi:hypothetical protein